jgi:outer membrane immunogenic protein
MKPIYVAAVLCAVAVAGGQALAADLPPPVAPPPRAPAVYVPVQTLYNWTGFYIGGNVGAGWGQGSFSDPNGNSFNGDNTARFLGGGQVGFNYQFMGGVVVGAEADFDWRPNTNNTQSIILAPSGTPASVTVNNQWLTTFTGRLGYAWDRVLVYGKGGGAWVGSSNPTIAIAGVSNTFNSSSSNFGWTIGAGLEYAFWGTWSVRAEYDYIGLASNSFTVPGTSTVLPNDIFTGSGTRSIQMVNLGINYKFGY